MRDRLFKMLEEADCEATKCEIAKKFYPIGYEKSRIEIIADSLLSAGVLVPPCEIGQTGYWITQRGIMPVVFDRIYLRVGNEWRIRASYHATESAYFNIDDFGKRVFLDRQEAQKAARTEEQ